jgi:uncharacterized protein (DUF4415 family)
MSKSGGKTVRIEGVPEVTPEQRARLEALAARPDEEIDTSDIAPLDEEFWSKATPGRFYRPVKQQLTIRLDADVLAWLRSAGKGYQTKLNDILRRAMARETSGR